MSFVITPEVRKTSEIRYHSDTAPGLRHVLVGSTLDPRCRLYIVGRQVEAVPRDQREWLDDHRHNCPTFYVLIGPNPDLTGLAAEIVIEGRPFVAESPSAILLPTGYLHHHRLTAGGGWSLHVNVRPDYEESLLDFASGTAPPMREVGLDRVYRRAELGGPEARLWETEDEALAPDELGSAPPLWTFIDPARFEDPGVRLHAVPLTPGGKAWSESTHRHTTDEVMIVLPHGADARPGAVRVAVECTTPAGNMIARAPASVYAPAETQHRCRHLEGTGLALKFLRLD